MKKFALSGVVAAATVSLANVANAAGGCTGPNQGPECATAVPEISAMEGTAALAALVAVLLLTWERRRRAH